MGSQGEGAVRIGIIGGGVAGLAAAYELAGAGNAQVHIFENGPELGGLAAGFKGRTSWEWPLEKFYHHLFTNDDDIMRLTETIGAGDLLQIHRPSTVIHHRGGNYPLDSPCAHAAVSALVDAAEATHGPGVGLFEISSPPTLARV